MNVVEDILEAIAPTYRDHKPRAAFGLEQVSRHEYHSPDGMGGVEQDGRDWTAWRNDDVRSFPTMKAAAKFARKG